MSSMEDRRDAFEKKFAHDEELRFRVEARTCKLFGQWAAQQLGLAGEEAEAYAKQVIGANLEEPGYADVKRKVMGDFAARNVSISEHLLDRQLEKFTEEAKAQLIAAG